jgi:putative ATP-dependent endonuclease of the OLD family
MPSITKIVLKNFRRFEHLTLELAKDLNILLGDNEAGKSSVLLAVDLVLSASRSKVESLGVETLLTSGVVDAFMKGERSVRDLPILKVEVYLSDGGDPDYNGKNNSSGVECDGLTMECQVPDKDSRDVAELLNDPQAPFPFEYYETAFNTFAGLPYSPYKKHIRHLVLDSSRIDSDYAAREYTRSLYAINTQPRERSKLESDYRRSKIDFQLERLRELNAKVSGYEFAVRTSTKSNLENDLVILEEKIPLDNRGKGRQCLVKAEFALSKGAHNKLDLLLLEEPENHLSHTSTRKLVDKLSKPDDRQVLLATHSSLICSRLDLRKALLLGATSKAQAVLHDLPEDTAEFFMKAPDNNVLEFALSKKVILVEGDAEYIVIDALYSKHSGGSTLEQDCVHVISVGGTSFKRYLDLAKLLRIKTAVIRDNDRNHEKNCVENYKDYCAENIRVFADSDNARSTFEICLYQDNKSVCDEYLGASRRTISVQDYMLANKADAAFKLLNNAASKLVAPGYIQEAIDWIRT